MSTFSGPRIVYAPTLRRLLRARDLVHARFAEPLTNAELAREACLEVGFSSVGSFSTLFRRHTGASPSTWLRELRVVVPVRAAWPLLYVPSCFLHRFAGPPDSLAPQSSRSSVASGVIGDRS